MGVRTEDLVDLAEPGPLAPDGDRRLRRPPPAREPFDVCRPSPSPPGSSSSGAAQPAREGVLREVARREPILADICDGSLDCFDEGGLDNLLPREEEARTSSVPALDVTEPRWDSAAEPGLDPVTSLLGCGVGSTGWSRRTLAMMSSTSDMSITSSS